MYRENPKYWLSHAAKTTAEMEGWSELTPAQESSMRGDSIADRIRAYRDRMIREGKDPDAL